MLSRMIVGNHAYSCPYIAKSRSRDATRALKPTIKYARHFAHVSRMIAKLTQFSCAPRSIQL